VGDRQHRTDTDERRCDWCRRRLPEAARTGRPRRFCRSSCRQRAYEARRRLEEAAWSEERLRSREGTLDEVALVAAALTDLVDEPTIGPVVELHPDEVEELVDRVRRFARDLVALTDRTDGTPGTERT
jgi:plasmid stabilization system protein ParE